MLRLHHRALPGPDASGPPAHRTIGSEAVGSCLNNQFSGELNHPLAAPIKPPVERSTSENGQSRRPIFRTQKFVPH